MVEYGYIGNAFARNTGDDFWSIPVVILGWSRPYGIAYAQTDCGEFHISQLTL